MSRQETTLTLTSSLPDSRLQGMTYQLAQDLRTSGVGATPVEKELQEGKRGDAIAIGQLAIELLTSGSAIALIACLKIYLDRDRTLKIELDAASGKKVSIDAKNIETEEIQDLIRAMDD